MLTLKERIGITGVLASLKDRWEVSVEFKNEEEAELLLTHYHSLLLYLISTGWMDCLPFGVGLEDKYMPQQYLDIVKCIEVPSPPEGRNYQAWGPKVK